MGFVPKFVLSASASPMTGPKRAAILGGKKRSGAHFGTVASPIVCMYD